MTGGTVAKWQTRLEKPMVLGQMPASRLLEMAEFVLGGSVESTKDPLLREAG